MTNYQTQAVRIGVPCFMLGFYNEKCTTPQRTREDWRKESGESWKNKKVEAERYRFRYQEKLMSALHSAVASGQFGWMRNSVWYPLRSKYGKLVLIVFRDNGLKLFMELTHLVTKEKAPGQVLIDPRICVVSWHSLFIRFCGRLKIKIGMPW